MSRDFTGLYKEEILVRTGGRDWWFPVQDSLMGDFDAEVKPGSEVDLYLLWAGVARDDLFLLVTEIRAVPP